MQGARPARQRAGIAVIDLDGRMQRLRAHGAQARVERVAEAAELRVVAVAQRQHRVLHVLQFLGGRVQQAVEAARGVGWLALPETAGDEQRALVLDQLRRRQFFQRMHVHRHAGRLQGRRALQRQALGRTGLAGVGQQDGVRTRSDRTGAAGSEFLAFGSGAAFLLAPIQVQHPAGDGKAGQGQADEEHHDPARHAEEAAHVQRIDRRLRLAAHRHLRVRLVLDHGAGLLVERHAAARAHVRRIFRSPDDLQRRGGAFRYPQERHAPVGRGAFERGPAGGQVHRWRLDALGRLGTGYFARHTRYAEPAIDRAAHHVETPVHAGQCEDHVTEHHPGAHYRVQAPQERTAFQAQIELEPGAPVASAARPAQIQAAQRQSQQA